MAVLKVRGPANEWLDIATAGATGPTGPAGLPGIDGPTGPTGPLSGVRVAAHVQGNDVVTGAANAMTDLCTGSVHLKPDHWYQISAGFRAIADLGAAGIAQMEVGINGVKLPTHSVIATAADEALWGSWQRTWVRQGSAFAVSEGDYSVTFKASTSVATKTIYAPEVSVLELQDTEQVGTGPQGPTGPAGPGTVDVPRGFVGQVGPDPRNPTMTTAVAGGAANVWTNILVGDITLDPTRMYQVHAGIRTLSDAGGDCNVNVALNVPAMGIFDDYFTATGAAVGLFGSWNQQIVLSGAKLLGPNIAVPSPVTFTLKSKTSLGPLQHYLPRCTVIDVGPV